MGAFDDLIPQQQKQGAFADLIPQQPKRDIQPQELSLGERLVSALPKKAQDWLFNPSIAGVNLGQGSAVNGAMMGAADPVVGAAQLLTGGQSKTINQAIDQKNTQYEQARAGQGRDGFDAARLVGNIASPANLAIAQVAPINAVSTGGKILQGARAGALGSAMAPVSNADESFIPEKALQTGIGALAGSLLTPVASKAGEAITRKAIGLPAAELKKRTDDIMLETVNRLRQDGVTVNAFDLNSLRSQVAQALKDGIEVDAAALARKSDFEKLGMQPTLGQITRDPTQYSREKNLRGVAGVGDPLMRRFDTQSKRMQELIAGRSAGAADEFSAGERFMSSLKGVDDDMRKNVTALYNKARNSTGKDIDIPVQGLAQDYANVLKNFGDKVPAGVRNNFEELGLLTGKQNKIFNFEEADNLLKVINSNKSNDPAVNTALSQLRDAVKNAALSVDNTGGPYATAVAAARKRFDLHDAAPALKSAVDGDISAQDFVKRYLINGKAEDVSSLAKVMPEEAKAEARRQLGAAIERAAFGQNMSGDKAFAQESFAKFINQPGMKQKIGAFFSPQEVQEFERIARVGAYVSSFPANNVVNTSNTAGAMMNLLSRTPGVPAAVNMLGAAKNAVQNQSAVKSAMAAQPGQSFAKPSKEQAELLARVLGYGMGGIAGATGTGIGN